MRTSSICFGALLTGLLYPSAGLLSAPGDADWQAVKSIIQEKPRQEDATQRADRLKRFETARAAALAAAPANPLRWDASLFTAMGTLLGTTPRPAAEVVESQLANLRELLNAADASAETKRLSSALLVHITSRTVKSPDSARAWVAQAEQHLATYPTSATRASDSNFDPEMLGMLNTLIQSNLTRATERLKQEGAGTGKAPPK